MSYAKKKESNKRYAKTIKGLSAVLFTSMRRRSKLRGHDSPSFTLCEFREWLYDKDEFNSLYKTWVESKYYRFLKPSIDRIDDSKGYSFDNMQVVTWQENDDKGKASKETKVKAFIDGIWVQFESVTKASEELEINRRSISNVLSGLSKTAGGLKWEYL